jgi:hypothetical protein
LSGVTVRFNAPPAISLEEAIALYLDPASGAIRRTTATSMTNALKPGWAPANELAANVSSLDFLYYDAQAQEVIPDTLNRRAGIDHIRVSLVVRTSAPLSNGSWPTYKMTTRVVPRNLRIR